MHTQTHTRTHKHTCRAPHLKMSTKRSQCQLYGTILFLSRSTALVAGNSEWVMHHSTADLKTCKTSQQLCLETYKTSQQCWLGNILNITETITWKRPKTSQQFWLGNIQSITEIVTHFGIVRDKTKLYKIWMSPQPFSTWNWNSRRTPERCPQRAEETQVSRGVPNKMSTYNGKSLSPWVSKLRVCVNR